MNKGYLEIYFKMDIAIYLRVSTPKKKDIGKGKDNPYLQNPDVQLAPLKKFAEFREWGIFRVYIDRMSGTKNEERPAYKELWKDARTGSFKAVLVWRFDRFARTTLELIKSLDEFKSLGIGFISSMEQIDTTTPMGKAMFTMIAAFAEFERSITIERVVSGMVRAKELGTKSGNAIGRPKKIFRRDLAIEMRLAGKSVREIARELEICPAIVHRELVGVSKPTPDIVRFPGSTGPMTSASEALYQ